MNDARWRERPTYSTRLLRPFLEAVAAFPDLQTRMADAIATLGERVAVDVAHLALSAAVEHTRDPDLGLKAAQRLSLGAAGGLDYVLCSSPNVRAAVEASRRYSRAINDVLDVALEEGDATASLWLRNSVTLPRAAADFLLGGYYRNHLRSWFDGHLHEVTVCVPGDAPADPAEYRVTFAPSPVRFGVEAMGFSFPRRLLELELPRADPNLHEVMVTYVDEAIGRLPAPRTTTSEVRALIQADLAAGGPDASRVAAKLGMSLRTLSRRLAAEGTTYRDLTDDVRRGLALDWVGNSSAELSDIAARLGFSHGAAFHRAFRRWTGQPPLRYRRSRGR